MSNIPSGHQTQNRRAIGLGGKKQGELGLHGGSLSLKRDGEMSGLVMDGDASCLQGGSMFIAGLVAKGVIF